MSSRFRSSSLGAVPHKKPLSRSRAESSHAGPLEVRCACQFFQSDSLIPERINPIGSRPQSRIGDLERPIDCFKHNVVDSTVEEENLSGSVLSFGKNSVPDYYAETNNDYRIGSTEDFNNKENEQLSLLSQPLSFDTHSIPSIEVESYRRDFPTNIGQTINLQSQSKSGTLRGRFSSQNINFSSHSVNNRAPSEVDFHQDIPTVNVSQSGVFARRFSSQNIRQTEVEVPRRQLSSQNLNQVESGEVNRNFSRHKAGSFQSQSPVRSSNQTGIRSLDRISPLRIYNNQENPLIKTEHQQHNLNHREISPIQQQREVSTVDQSFSNQDTTPIQPSYQNLQETKPIQQLSYERKTSPVQQKYSKFAQRGIVPIQPSYQNIREATPIQQPCQSLQEAKPLQFPQINLPQPKLIPRQFPIQNIIPPTPPPNQIMKGQFSSQKSLDRYSTSTLLRKYQQKSQSVAPSLHNSTADVRIPFKMTKTVSFDYGKPAEKPSNNNPNFDQYHCMSPMVFPHDKMRRMQDSR